MTEEILTVSLDSIDDPLAPMREHMNEQKLDELANSIKTHGLIQPITLRRVGDRYEVVAGHRRFKAAKRAGLVTIPAVVRELSETEGDELKIHENLFREDVNPVDEARFIVRMIEVYDLSPKDLAERTGKSESYLRGRYELLKYPDYLVTAVAEEKISLSAAQWLSRITDENVLREYTRFAMLGGITAKRAEAWYRSWSLGNLPREAHMYVAPEEDEQSEPAKLEDTCVICQHKDEVFNMKMGYAHAECVDATARAARDH